MSRVLFFIFLITSSIFANSLKVDKIASNLGVVWGMTFIDDEKILFTIKSAEIGTLDLKTKKINYLLNRPKVLYNGQGGLLDVKASPNFREDKTVYFTYVKEVKGSGVTTLAKAKYINNDLEDWEDILITKSASDTTRHFGSRIAFDDKHIYFSIGDRGVRPNSQDLSNHAGTIIRLNFDGTIPKDNPFINRKDALPEIYSYGHRNPQGLFYDKKEKRLWSIEHGPRGGDEINLVEKGLNYGWPVISYGKEYWNPFPVGESTYKKGMQQPIKYYDPSIAPSSLIIYRGDEFSSWDGSLLSGALKLRHLNVVKLDKNLKPIKEERYLESLGERIRNIVQSPRGKLYISTDNGNIYKVEKM